MLEIRNLTKAYWQGDDEVKVVDNISLQVKKGQVFGFLGPNGAGKTTTVKAIVGLITPDSGRININGIPQTDLNSKLKLGFMPENPQFYNHLKASEVMEFAAHLFGIDEKPFSKRLKKLLEQVGLPKDGDKMVRKFSKGMIQRLAFAVALVNEPDLLILDEPLDGLDPIGRLDFKQLLIELKKKGKTVFFSSHILADVEEIADEVAIINKGHLVAQGSPKLLVGNKFKTLEQMFVETVKRT